MQTWKCTYWIGTFFNRLVNKSPSWRGSSIHLKLYIPSNMNTGLMKSVNLQFNCSKYYFFSKILHNSSQKSFQFISIFFCKIKIFECPKPIRKYEKEILGTSNAWLTIRLPHWPGELVYYIVNWRIYALAYQIHFMCFCLFCPQKVQFNAKYASFLTFKLQWFQKCFVPYLPKNLSL